MKSIQSFLEHTYLKADIGSELCEQLVSEALKYEFAGLCIPPFWLKKVRRDLGSKSSVNLVTVIGFPFGWQKTENKLHEMETAARDGADEFDLVMNLSAFRTNSHWVKTETARAAKLAHGCGCMLKIIIETANLSKDEIIHAAKICADGGADFIKTSTGYAKEGAKAEDISLLRDLLPDSVGIKASGGIRDFEAAKAMIEAGADRIGTSSAIKIVNEARNA